MRTEKEETMKMDELINSIELRSPSPGKDHSAEKSFSRLMTRIQPTTIPLTFSADAPINTGYGSLLRQ